MTRLGYALSSEEHAPAELVEYAALAEERGFDFAPISDHFHPWIDRQGEAPFVWSVLGGIAEATSSIEVGTGVTCPIRRLHPAIVAQAGATAASMLPDRFFLGVGSGENLNEHVVGERWPPAARRLELLEEAVDVIRSLWTGEQVTHRGDHFTVEDARLYTVPDDPPPIHVAAGGETSAAAAGAFGDGLVSTAPEAALVDAYDGDGPRYGQATVCWAESDDEARSMAHEWWPNGAIPGALTADLPTPDQFEAAADLLDEADVAERVTCSADPDDHVEAIQAFVDAGYDHVYVHQVGPEQRAFLDAYEAAVLPSFR